jgi:hypothetical protein
MDSHGRSDFPSFRATVAVLLFTGIGYVMLGTQPGTSASLSAEGVSGSGISTPQAFQSYVSPLGCRPAATWWNLGRILPRAYAASCPSNPCANDRMVEEHIDCVPPGCQGIIKAAIRDPVQGPPWIGARNDGTFGCTSAPGYTCSENMCNYGICDHCSPELRCPADMDCITSTGGRCVNGCCEQTPCTSCEECGHRLPLLQFIL